MFFTKKKADTMPADEIKRLDKKPLKYVVERCSETASERRLGENGAVNIIDGDFVLVCGGKDVFRAPLGKVKIGLLMNLSGVTAVYTDESGKRRSVTGYFSDGAVGGQKNGR